MAGQITKKSEGTWLVRIFLGRDAGGKRKYFSKAIHGTKKDAQKYLTAKLREKDLGQFVEPAYQTLSHFLDQWLKEVAGPRVKEATLNGYRWYVDNYIKKYLGTRRLADLRAYHVQKFYNDLLGQGLSPRSIQYTHSVLSSALKQAVKWQMIAANPCAACDLPQRKKAEMKCFTAAEVRVFLEAARPTKYYALFLLAMETGLRPGEYLGLQWKDVDLEARTLSVKRVMKVRKGGGFYFAEPKTNRSRRSVPLSPVLVAELREHRRGQYEEILALGTAYERNDLVFANEIGKPLLIENVRRRHFEKIIAAANGAMTKNNQDGGASVLLLPAIRLYDLRHTCATLLLSAGLNPKIVSERLGHASIVLTLDTYSHVLPTMQKEATDKLEQLMFGT